MWSDYHFTDITGIFLRDMKPRFVAGAAWYCTVLAFCWSYCDKKNKKWKREFAPDDLNNSVWTESTTEEWSGWFCREVLKMIKQPKQDRREWLWFTVHAEAEFHQVIQLNYVISDFLCRLGYGEWELFPFVSSNKNCFFLAATTFGNGINKLLWLIRLWLIRQFCSWLPSLVMLVSTW